MKISQKGIDLIKGFEGVRLKAYNATGQEKFLTIGYGHYGPDVKPNETITQAEAENLLKTDLVKYENGVKDNVRVPLNQFQFDSLVSFTYNCGVGALKTSTLCKKLNQKDYQGAADEFLKWTRGSGRILPGLVKRRTAERTLFLTPVPAPKPIPKPLSLTHTVKKGENLTLISKKYGVSIDSIVKLNKLHNANQIYAGQLLKIK